MTDHAGHTTRLTYDSLGRKLAMADPDMGRWTYAYDAVDNLKTQTDARGVTISFTYDALNRLTQKSYALPPAPSPEPTAPVTYTYDDPAVPFATGKLTKIVEGSGSSTFAYDALGRVTQVFGPLSATEPMLRYTYDPCLGTAACPAPIRTTACARVASGTPEELCTSTFTDGLGRTIQTRSPAEDSTKEVILTP